jgi:hypothetical protein
MTLQEILDTCPDWLKFCEMKGFDEYAVNEGGGHIEVNLSVQEACKLGIIKDDNCPNLLKEGSIAHKEIANRFKVARPLITDIKNGKRWSNITIESVDDV